MGAGEEDGPGAAPLGNRAEAVIIRLSQMEPDESVQVSSNLHPFYTT